MNKSVFLFLVTGGLVVLGVYFLPTSEVYVLFFVLAWLSFCAAVYTLVTNYKKENLDVSGQILNLQKDKISTEMNRFAAAKESKSALKRKELAINLSAEAEARGALGTAQVQSLTAEDAVRNAPVRLAEIRKQEEATHNNLLVTANEASERKVSPLALDEIRKDEERMRLEIEKHREMKEIDKDVYRFEKEIDMKGAIIARVAPVYEVNFLTEQLNRALNDRELLLLEPNSDRKKKMLKRLDKNIKLLNGAIDAKGQGLIQGDNRRKLGPVDED